MAHRIVVISDLHLGGRQDATDPDGASLPGSALANSAGELTAFIGWLTSQVPNGRDRLELVINGDIFDFLCELDDHVQSGSFTWFGREDLALEIAASLERQFGGRGGLLEAMRIFLATGGALTLLIGNHDVELSYPQVRAWLHNVLDSDGKRLKFIFDGEAYTCKDVLIEHGNRYDPWNVIDHDAMRRDRSRMSRGETGASEPAPHFHPPAGSYMVVHVLNLLKKQYRFVDLLKPETELVLPIILTVCPPALGVLRSLAAASAQMGRQLATTRGVSAGAPRRVGYLRAETASADGDPFDLKGLLEASAHLFEQEIKSLDTRRSGDLSAAADLADDLAKQVREFTAGTGKFLTFAGLLRSASRETTLARLHAAIIRLNRSDPFALDQESEPYLNAAQRIADRQFRVIVFGHTHLPKELELSGGAKYINTGTWADVLRIPAAALEPGDAGRRVLETFADDLASNSHARYALRRLTYADIQMSDAGSSIANLWEFKSMVEPRCHVAGEAMC